MSRNEAIQQLQPNSIIVTNTSLVEASRIIKFGESSTPYRNYDSSDFLRYKNRGNNSAILRLVEFCNIAEAVVLNECIYTLPSIDPPEISGESLVQLLRDEGICQELPSIELSQKAIKSSLALLGNIGNDKVYEAAIPYIESKSWLPGHDDIEEMQNSSWNFNKRSRQFQPSGPIPPYKPDEFEKRWYEDRSSRRYSNEFEDGITETSLAKFFHLVRATLQYQVSPNTSDVIYVIRNVLYWVTAEHYRVSYFPDLARSEWTSEWIKNWQESLSRKTYSIVAKAFRENVEQVVADEQPTRVFLPLVAALVLSKTKQVSEIPNALLDVREEFSSFRSQFADLENEQRNATSIAQRQRIKRRIRELFEAVTKKSNVNEERLLVSAIGYTDEVADIIKSPTDPKGYISLLQQSSDWMRSWWVARPAFKLFSLRRRVERLPQYVNLSQQLIGRELTTEEISEFKKEYSTT